MKLTRLDKPSESSLYHISHSERVKCDTPHGHAFISFPAYLRSVPHSTDRPQTINSWSSAIEFRPLKNNRRYSVGTLWEPEWCKLLLV